MADVPTIESIGKEANKAEVLKMLGKAMIITMTGRNEDSFRIGYNMPELLNSDIVKQNFTDESKVEEILLYFQDEYGITHADLHREAKNVLWRFNQLNQVRYENAEIRKEYLRRHGIMENIVEEIEAQRDEKEIVAYPVFAKREEKQESAFEIADGGAILDGARGESDLEPLQEPEFDQLPVVHEVTKRAMDKISEVVDELEVETDEVLRETVADLRRVGEETQTKLDRIETQVRREASKGVISNGMTAGERAEEAASKMYSLADVQRVASERVTMEKMAGIRARSEVARRLLDQIDECNYQINYLEKSMPEVMERKRAELELNKEPGATEANAFFDSKIAETWQIQADAPRQIQEYYQNRQAYLNQARVMQTQKIEQIRQAKRQSTYDLNTKLQMLGREQAQAQKWEKLLALECELHGGAEAHRRYTMDNQQYGMQMQRCMQTCRERDAIFANCERYVEGLRQAEQELEQIYYVGQEYGLDVSRTIKELAPYYAVQPTQTYVQQPYQPSQQDNMYGNQYYQQPVTYPQQQQQQSTFGQYNQNLENPYISEQQMAGAGVAQSAVTQVSQPTETQMSESMMQEQLERILARQQEVQGKIKVFEQDISAGKEFFTKEIERMEAEGPERNAGKLREYRELLGQLDNAGKEPIANARKKPATEPDRAKPDVILGAVDIDYAKYTARVVRASDAKAITVDLDEMPDGWTMKTLLEFVGATTQVENLEALCNGTLSDMQHRAIPNIIQNFEGAFEGKCSEAELYRRYQQAQMLDGYIEGNKLSKATIDSIKKQADATYEQRKKEAKEECKSEKKGKKGKEKKGLEDARDDKIKGYKAQCKSVKQGAKDCKPQSMIVLPRKEKSKFKKLEKDAGDRRGLFARRTQKGLPAGKKQEDDAFLRGEASRLYQEYKAEMDKPEGERDEERIQQLQAQRQQNADAIKGIGKRKVKGMVADQQQTLLENNEPPTMRENLIVPTSPSNPGERGPIVVPDTRVSGVNQPPLQQEPGEREIE